MLKFKGLGRAVKESNHSTDLNHVIALALQEGDCILFSLLCLFYLVHDPRPQNAAVHSYVGLPISTNPIR